MSLKGRNFPLSAGSNLEASSLSGMNFYNNQKSLLSAPFWFNSPPLPKTPSTSQQYNTEESKKGALKRAPILELVA